MLCESATGYILQMSVYRGRHFDPVPAGVLQGTRVVVDLMQSSSHLNKGYHVFCDSYFCSINLATQLQNHIQKEYLLLYMPSLIYIYYM
jgi:NAD+--asparagine ADP-ribosyltransferase